ncbi:hypothetical protein B0H67DRAFT_491050 [Lasiosphaeris hirsuta]|uniref:DUF924-domain-containing protein n=1 Tax=Lasiosphaeris hirsuta TaxID=260670 RepID=A0AA40A7M3_9PEZI|nr:hypothetical protein B0H67DRAFT_491050 [Lasiosphaeris hirsuta]
MSPPPTLRSLLGPCVLESVRTLWFQNESDESKLMLPTGDLAKQWFRSDREFDKVCLDAFGEQLEYIQSSKATATDILAAAAPSSALDWLSLVLLLDQLPRNCYRGNDAKVVFAVFDPIALDITLQAIKVGIPQAPEIKYNMGYRMWFYLPLQHSEDQRIQAMSMKENEGIFTDMQTLMNSPDSSVAEDKNLERRRALLLAGKEAVSSWERNLLDFARIHKVIIDQFGRYPHRNKALGRESTDAEVKYLADGGETFGSG